tara:strand:+ start:625 stop:1479 length:855 start_codon:yes stop_codon:yes gene_type:complete
MITFSPAKINLFLEVLSKKSNGLHNINSLMCICNIGDKINVVKSDDYDLQISGEFKEILAGKENIVNDVFFKLKEEFKIKENIKIVITKELPISSGIGGGSSNAASLFKTIEILFELKICYSDKSRLLNSFGSDVPFCYHKNPSIVTGTGDKISDAKSFYEFYLLLINPLVEISTKDVFKKINKKYTKYPTIINSGLNKEQFINILQKSSNDLEKIVLRNNKAVKSIMNFLNYETKSLFSRMSGSGGTCFGLFENYNDLKSAYNDLKKTKKKWWFKKGKILNKI